MKTEKVVISFIAIAIGLFVAGVAFYFYQKSKTVSLTQTATITKTSPTSTPKSSLFLIIDEPTDEDVIDAKTVKVSGKTIPNATIIISTTITQEVVRPAKNGSFSVTVTIEDGQNLIDIISIAPTGEEIQDARTITYSAENF
ncbi:MAG: hypothetical protein HY429_00130 [Candidatus Levybacteria bacterium]|nr:hypothetical protein [Candidatus Levybacteria bacterium]